MQYSHPSPRPTNHSRKGVERGTWFGYTLLAAEICAQIAETFQDTPVLIVNDSWYGNDGLLKPMRKTVGPHGHILSRLRANASLFDSPPMRYQYQRCGPKRVAANVITRPNVVTPLAIECTSPLSHRRKRFTQAALDQDFIIVFSKLNKPIRNSFIRTLLRMLA